MPDTIRFVPTPEDNSNHAAEFLHWYSSDRRWKVTRVRSKFGRDDCRYAAQRIISGDRYDVIGRDPLGPGYPKYHRTLGAALASIEFASGMLIGNRSQLHDPELPTTTGDAKMTTETIPAPTETREMRVSREKAVALLKATGFKSKLDKFSNKELAAKLNKLPTLELTEVTDWPLKELLDDVFAAVADEQGIIVEDAEKETTMKGDAKPAAGAGKNGKAIANGKGNKDKPSAKPTSSSKAEKKVGKGEDKAPAKTSPKRGPGVLSTIIDCLGKASKKEPATVDEIHKVLVKRFPERNPKSMRDTIKVSLGSQFKKEKGLDVAHNDSGGYWLPREELAKLSK